MRDREAAARERSRRRWLAPALRASAFALVAFVAWWSRSSTASAQEAPTGEGGALPPTPSTLAGAAVGTEAAPANDVVSTPAPAAALAQSQADDLGVATLRDPGDPLVPSPPSLVPDPLPTPQPSWPRAVGLGAHAPGPSGEAAAPSPTGAGLVGLSRPALVS